MERTRENDLYIDAEFVEAQHMSRTIGPRPFWSTTRALLMCIAFAIAHHLWA
jgi:hypothetical protein